MAGRRYVRDNRGRFATVGATARGGRLSTASGNKRKTVKASPGIADRMSSAPQGTIGKTRSARFSQHVDRPLDKRPAYKQGFTDQKAAIASRKGPKEMSLEEFASKTGGKTRADSMGLAIEMSRQPNGRTKAGDRRNEKRLKELQNQVSNTKAQYEAAIKSGQIKAPVHSIARTAQGHPDNPAVQAAQRLMAKNAARKAAAAQGDGAVVNISMAGRRGRSLDAEITRNVKAQKAADRAESKVRNRQFKSEQSRAKKLRSVHVPAIAKAKGISRAQVESALQAQSPSTQIKALKNWVKANRKNAR